MAEKPVLNDLFIKPDFDNSHADISFSPPQGLENCLWTISGPAEKERSGEAAAGNDRVSFEAEMKDFRSWSIEDPFLYTLTLGLQINGTQKTLQQTFGMTKVHVQDKQIYFNNKPLYVRGHIRGREAHDHPDLRGQSEEDYYRRNIQLSKDFGFNFIRFHSKIPTDAYFKAADELGILTHVEIRKYYGKYQKERELMDHDPVLVKPKDWQEEVLRVRNHPSLLVYCMGNEINNPGNNPQVKAIFDLTRELDDSRLFIDTCARGQYDRGNVDLDVQHMSYYCPFGRNYGMFNTTANWGIFGSTKGKTIVDEQTGAETRREIPVNFPVLGHEVCHYTSYRDIDGLEAKFEKYSTEKPWWLAEIKALIKLKGLEKDWPEMLASSKQYQHAWWKQGIESARRSPLLGGYHFLQFADTELYENSNGPLDCFDDPQNCDPEAFKQFNGDSVLIADLPVRCFSEKETIEIPIWLSHFSHTFSSGTADLTWSLTSSDGIVDIKGSMQDFDLDRLGLAGLCTLTVTLPVLETPVSMQLCLELKQKNATITANSWKLWAFPDRPDSLPVKEIAFKLQDINPRKRYPAMIESDGNEKLLITDRLNQSVLDRLDTGGDVLLLYRIKENRDFKAEREEFYLPSTRDRFKGTIWDRGHQNGGFLRQHPVMDVFPHEGFIDFQFARLIDDADKLNLDDFPVEIVPAIQGNDKAARDRFDVYTFGLRELQPAWALRKFGYLFELMVGKGRLLVCGFNFTGMEKDLPEVSWLFEELVGYARSKAFKPDASIEAAALSSWLKERGADARILERKMTQYWVLDEEPLESAQYWIDSENRIKEEMKRGLDKRENRRPLIEGGL
ncbi:glycoside hydrolase family 2 TIM barrel-domain containing protein [Planctomycetota bacterium]